MGPMMPPDGRKWQLIYPNSRNRLQDIMSISIMTLIIVTLSTMILSITTHSIMTLNRNVTKHKGYSA
jgi:hypothetical protein